MRQLKKVLRKLTDPDQARVSMATHRELIELLLPKHYRYGERAEKVSQLAWMRLVREVRGSGLTQLLMWGLQNQNESVRDACAEQLCFFDEPEVTDALVGSLRDPSSWVRTHAAIHLRWHARHLRPGQAAEILQSIKAALPLETNQSVRECLEAAAKRLETL